MPKPKKVRQEEAQARQAVYDKLSPALKLARAANRRGASKREVERLTRLVEVK